jgi:hypothetical protein
VFILMPLQYCEFRGPEGQCHQFASGTVAKMSFCDGHGRMVENAVQAEEVVFIEPEEGGKAWQSPQVLG